MDLLKERNKKKMETMNKKRRKYYFRDYTKKIDLTKKLKNFLVKYKDSHEMFHYKELGKFLKKQLYNKPSTMKNKNGKIKYLKSSLLKDDILFQIQSGFDILSDIEYIKDFEFEHLPKQDSYLINVEFYEEEKDFENLLKNSIYYPIKGEKQELTLKLRENVTQNYFIDYTNMLKECDSNEYKTKAEFLQKKLVDIWSEHYKIMTNKQTFIHEIKSDFSFLFDIQSYSDEEDFTEDRIVVTYGFSKISKVKRDNSRLNGYLRGAWAWTDKDTDKGHFIGHSLGGNLDENIFPQKTDINRGWCDRGKVYRKMETYCASHEDTFCFSRPIYCDFSTRPFVLEYGVLKEDGSLWVEWFDNV